LSFKFDEGEPSQFHLVRLSWPRAWADPVESFENPEG
jgi:hypothetical protein